MIPETVSLSLTANSKPGFIGNADELFAIAPIISSINKSLSRAIELWPQETLLSMPLAVSNGKDLFDLFYILVYPQAITTDRLTSGLIQINSNRDEVPNSFINFNGISNINGLINNIINPLNYFMDSINFFNFLGEKQKSKQEKKIKKEGK